jgi:hypothetical protein
MAADLNLGAFLNQIEISRCILSKIGGGNGSHSKDCTEPYIIVQACFDQRKMEEGDAKE